MCKVFTNIIKEIVKINETKEIYSKNGTRLKTDSNEMKLHDLLANVFGIGLVLRCSPRSEK